MYNITSCTGTSLWLFRQSWSRLPQFHVLPLPRKSHEYNGTYRRDQSIVAKRTYVCFSDSCLVLLLALKNSWVILAVLSTDKLKSEFVLKHKRQTWTCASKLRTKIQRALQTCTRNKVVLGHSVYLVQGSEPYAQEIYQPDPLSWYDTVTPSYYTQL